MQKCSQCSVRKQMVKRNESSFNVLINRVLIRNILYLYVNRALPMVSCNNKSPSFYPLTTDVSRLSTSGVEAPHQWCGRFARVVRRSESHEICS